MRIFYADCDRENILLVIRLVDLKRIIQLKIQYAIQKVNMYILIFMIFIKTLIRNFILLLISLNILINNANVINK